VLARPTSASWKNSYGEFFLARGSAIAGMEDSRSGLSIEPLRAEFVQTFEQMRTLPHEVRLSAASPAVRGGRLLVTPEVLEWWPHCFAESRLLYRTPDGWTEADPASGGLFVLPVPDADRAEIECEVHVVRKTYYEPAAGATVPVGARRLTLSIETAPQSQSPRRSPPLDSYVQELLYVRWRDPPEVVLRQGVAERPDVQHVVFGGILELSRNGVVAATCDVRLMWGNSSLTDCAIGEWRFRDRLLALSAANTQAEDVSEWSVRFYSDPAVAMMQKDATSYWVGEVQVFLRPE
jgi:hypothetical protein